MPERGLAAVISRDSLGGILLRRLLPTASLVPIVIGWLRMEGQKAGWYGTEFGLAMMVTVDVAIFVAVIYLSGAEIDRIATARHESELAMRTAQDGLLAMNYTFESVIDACPFSIITLDRQARVQVWNRAAEKMLGWSWLQIRGRAIPDRAGKLERRTRFDSRLSYRWRFRRRSSNRPVIERRPGRDSHRLGGSHCRRFARIFRRGPYPAERLAGRAVPELYRNSTFLITVHAF